MQAFYKWLEANGFIYTPGTYHWMNSGWWFPALPPDLEAEDVPGPFVWVQRDKENDAAFITRQGANAGDRETRYLETAERGKEVASRMLMAYDRALEGGGFGEFEPEDRLGDFGASANGPAGRFVQAWVEGKLGPWKTKEAALSRARPYSTVDVLYSYAVPIASIYDPVSWVKEVVAGRIDDLEASAIVRGDFGPEVSVLYDQCLSGQPLPDVRRIVVSTRGALSRTSVTTNRHLSWVERAAKQVFPAGRFAYLTEGQVPITPVEWQEALEAFSARAAGQPTARLQGFPGRTAEELGDELGVDWSEVNVEEFRKGLEVEMEHANGVAHSMTDVARIALDHLREMPDYYTRLEKMERP